MMMTLQAFLDSPLIHSLGWMLVHTLWQGMLLGVIYFGLRYLLRRRSSQARYYLAMAALGVMAVLPVITFIHLMSHGVGPAAPDAGTLLLANATTVTAHSVSAGPSWLEHLRLWLRSLIPWAVPVWLLGVLTMSLRVWRGWRRADQLRKSASLLPVSEWHAVVESLSAVLGINKLVRLAISSRVTVPSVVGWLKPIILIPPSVMAGLSHQQMELILAHELAHIRRQDYLWNLLQVTVETLLFYHPVVRWISHQARLEREQCCDDMVVKLRGNTLEYARALTELEGLRHPRTAFLVGATGGQVLDRVHRLLGQPTPNAPTFWLPLLLAAGLLGTTGLVNITRHTLTVPAILTHHYNLFGTHSKNLTLPAKIPHVATLPPTRLAAVVPSRPFTQPLAAMPRVQATAMPALGTLSPLSTPAPRPTTVALAPVPKTTAPTATGAKILSRLAPIYPRRALERGIEGFARLQFTLTPSGDVTHLRVTQIRGSRLFGEAAIEAIQQWKFEPATLAGQPVAQRMTEEFIFRLSGSQSSDAACKIPMGYHVCNPN